MQASEFVVGVGGVLVDIDAEAVEDDVMGDRAWVVTIVGDTGGDGEGR